VKEVKYHLWAYEAISVEQFKDNDYQKNIFEFEKEESQNNFKVAYWIPKMQELITASLTAFETGKNDSTLAIVNENLSIVKRELANDIYTVNFSQLDLTEFSDLAASDFNENISSKIWYHLEDAMSFYSLRLAKASDSKDSVLYVMKEQLPEGEELSDLKDRFYNDQLEDLMKNSSAEERIDIAHGKIIQIMDPIYQDVYNYGQPLNYRTQFLAPQKPFLGSSFGTYGFNLSVIWAMTIVLYLTLYLDALPKFMNFTTSIATKLYKKK